MMKQRIISCILCLCTVLIFVLSPLSASAAIIEKGHITVDTVSAVTGDTVIVKISIENNPGIMAMTLTINYDSSALTYEKYLKGYLRDYTVAAHPEKNIIRFVNCESLNYDYNGAMISLQFKVNDKASFDFHEISVSYGPGDLCNWDLDKILPTATAGGVDVQFNGSNCLHKAYSDWEIAAEPGCTTDGAKQRYCNKCGHADIKSLPAIGHDFEDVWTVDTPATETSAGSMSRHCIRCQEKTEILSFELAQTEEQSINNIIGTSIPPSEFTAQLVEEQKPASADSGISNTDDNSTNSGNGKTETKLFDEVINADDEETTIWDRLHEYLFEKNGVGIIGKIREVLPELKKLGYCIIALFAINFKLLTIF